MLTAAYFMLRDGVEYHDLGSHHFEPRDKEQLAKRLIQRLRDLGVAVDEGCMTTTRASQRFHLGLQVLPKA